MLNNKLKIMEKIFVKLGTFNETIFKKLYLFYIDNYIVYYDPSDKYQAPTEPLARHKWLYHLINITFVSCLIKFVALTFIQDDWLKIITGEFIFIFLTQYRRIYVYLDTGIIFIIMLKLALLYYEKKMIDDFRRIFSTNSNTSRLNYHETTLLILANVIYWCGKLIDLVCLSVFSIIIPIFALVAYFFTHYEFNPIILFISALQYVILAKIIINNIIGKVVDLQ